MISSPGVPRWPRPLASRVDLVPWRPPERLSRRLLYEAATSHPVIPFSDLSRAAFCPRQLYYTRREDDRSIPSESRTRIDLAFRYPELVSAPDRELRRLPIRRSPAAYRRNLSRLRERDDYDALVDPDRERAFVSGRDCHGTVRKVLRSDVRSDAGEDDRAEAESSVETNPETDAETDTEPPVPVVVSPGEPPETGVWEPQSVRAVAVAKALAWEHEREVPRALVEYPAVGVVREVRLTVRRTARYRRALRTARGIDGPPPRVDDDRCEACSYREECGTRTRSLRSLLR